MLVKVAISVEIKYFNDEAKLMLVMRLLVKNDKLEEFVG